MAPDPIRQLSRRTVAEDLYATLSTNQGDIRLKLFPNHAPKTVANFVELAEGSREWTDPRTGARTSDPLYNGTIFHRVISGFMIQGGDPLGTGTGGPGYKVVEKPPANLAYTKGTVAMAKSSAEPPGSSGSQFYVVTGADAGLPPEYALVGKVSQGLDVVERIGKLGTPTEKPKQTVLIETITIEKG
jgi:peptidyl-prolyl cis-trans isomerase A (cyclophilin A)